MLLLSPLIVAFRCGWRNRKDQRGDLLLGFGVALLTVYLHSFYEWVFVSFEIEYMFAATMGLIAGLAQELGYWRSARNPAIGIDQPIVQVQQQKHHWRQTVLPNDDRTHHLSPIGQIAVTAW